MFPAIKEAWREFRSGFGSQPEPLELKSAIGPDWYRQTGNSEWGILGEHRRSWSGEPVTVDSAQTHSVVWACERIISESIAFMPLQLMQRTRVGKRAAEAHPMYQALHYAPNEEMSAMGFRETLTAHCVMTGNAYAQIMRRSGTGVAYEMYPLLPTQVTPDRDKQKRLVYIVKEGNSQEKIYTVERGRPHDILHIRGLGNDGIRGYSVVTMARNSIGTAKSADKYAAKFYAAGGRTPWLLEMTQKFKDTQSRDQFRNDFTKWLSEDNNWHKGLILEPGMTYKNMGMSPEDSQFIETRQFNIPEVCRWFLVAPHLVGDLSRATFNNIEELALQFVKFTLTAWTTRWEQDSWRCILTPAEKQDGHYWKHNVNGLLRGDFQARMQGYASALQNGHLSINEVRDLEDRNPIEGGDQHFVQLNMQGLTNAGEPAATRVPVRRNA